MNGTAGEEAGVKDHGCQSIVDSLKTNIPVLQRCDINGLLTAVNR